MAFDFKNATRAELRSEYDRIGKEMGDFQFFTKRELFHLPKILADTEQVLAFTSGLMDNNTWLIALTDRRIIFLDKGMIYGLKQATIDLDKINAVSGETAILFGTIKIEDGARERVIANVWKKNRGAVYQSRARCHRGPPPRASSACRPHSGWRRSYFQARTTRRVAR